MGGDEFIVFVKLGTDTTPNGGWTGGKTTQLHVSYDTSVRDVKRLLQEKEGIPAKQQRLIFAGTQLHSRRNLASYSIPRESTLVLVTRPPKGGDDDDEPEVEEMDEEAEDHAEDEEAVARILQDELPRTGLQGPWSTGGCSECWRCW